MGFRRRSSRRLRRRRRPSRPSNRPSKGPQRLQMRRWTRAQMQTHPTSRNQSRMQTTMRDPVHQQSGTQVRHQARRHDLQPPHRSTTSQHPLHLQTSTPASANPTGHCKLIDPNFHPQHLNPRPPQPDPEPSPAMAPSPTNPPKNAIHVLARDHPHPSRSQNPRLHSEDRNRIYSRAFWEGSRRRSMRRRRGMVGRSEVEVF